MNSSSDWRGWIVCSVVMKKPRFGLEVFSGQRWWIRGEESVVPEV
jgi:hypothetical protein